MKRTLPALFGFLLLAAPAAPAQFTYTTTNGTITITGYNGPGGSVNIPNAINGLLVANIGDDAFSSTALTSVTIPNSVTTIGVAAFGGCEGLTSVTIPDSVTSLGDNAFTDCLQLTNVVIGNGLRSIGGRRSTPVCH